MWPLGLSYSLCGDGDLMNTFRKYNQSNFSDALFKEAEGLRLLNKVLNDEDINDVFIPEIYSVDHSELVIQKIQIAVPTETQMYQLGRSLAQLHQIEFDHYGFKHDNYIGLNPQPNEISKNWGAFFVEHRLG